MLTRQRQGPSGAVPVSGSRSYDPGTQTMIAQLKAGFMRGAPTR